MLNFHILYVNIIFPNENLISSSPKCVFILVKMQALILCTLGDYGDY